MNWNKKKTRTLKKGTFPKTRRAWKFGKFAVSEKSPWINKIRCACKKNPTRKTFELESRFQFRSTEAYRRSQHISKIRNRIIASEQRNKLSHRIGNILRNVMEQTKWIIENYSETKKYRARSETLNWAIIRWRAFAVGSESFASHAKTFVWYWEPMRCSLSWCCFCCSSLFASFGFLSK